MEEPNILIKTALSEAVQQVNAGVSPTEALKKIAVDLDLNPNYMQRTGEALNVALHYKHFKTASDRSIDFEIADIPKAIEEVFSSNHKTAAEQTSEYFSSIDTNESVFNYNRILSNPVYKRAFIEISSAPEVHDSFETTLKTVYEKSANYVQKLSKQAEDAEIHKTAAEIELNRTFSVLCDEFRKDAAYHTPFEEFESQVFSKHGSAATDYLDLIHKTACPSAERGIHDSGYIMFDPCKEASLFDNLLVAASKVIDTEKTAQEAKENLAFESSFLKECNSLLGKTAEKKENTVHEKSESSSEEKSEHTGENPAEDEDEEDPVMLAVKKKASDANFTITPKYDKDPVLEELMQKEAFLGSLTNMMSSLIAEPVHAAFSHTFKSTPPPSAGIKANLTLDNMERRLLLQELMLTDPILSKVNPAKVARAFEQILRLSPEISKQKEVVRAELRAMVASQALSKYDAEMMTKLDVGMLKSRVATQQFNRGLTDQFRV
jgi:hypothetical protein